MIVKARIIPNASRTEIAGLTDEGIYRVKVQAPPVEGAANRNLVRFFAGISGVSKSKVRIVGGEKSRLKTIEIQGDDMIIAGRLKGQL